MSSNEPQIEKITREIIGNRTLGQADRDQIEASVRQIVNSRGAQCTR